MRRRLLTLWSSTCLSLLEQTSAWWRPLLPLPLRLYLDKYFGVHVDYHIVELHRGEETLLTTRLCSQTHISCHFAVHTDTCLAVPLSHSAQLDLICPHSLSGTFIKPPPTSESSYFPLSLANLMIADLIALSSTAELPFWHCLCYLQILLGMLKEDVFHCSLLQSTTWLDFYKTLPTLVQFYKLVNFFNSSSDKISAQVICVFYNSAIILKSVFFNFKIFLLHQPSTINVSWSSNDGCRHKGRFT